MKEQVKKAINTRDLGRFILHLDTYKSTLADEKHLKKTKEFRTYIPKELETHF